MGLAAKGTITPSKGSWAEDAHASEAVRARRQLPSEWAVRVGQVAQSSRRFIADHWHGWLEVPLAELQDLGIASEISSKSFYSAETGMVYLEEDRDLPAYARAREARGLKSLPRFHDVQESFVRALPPFEPLRTSQRPN